MMSWWCLWASATSYVVFVRVCVGCSDPRYIFDGHRHASIRTKTHTHTHTTTLVTYDLNLEPEVAWGKVMSWMETDRQTDMVGNWTLVAIDDIQRALSLSTYSFIIVIIMTEASTFLSSGFLSLIWFQKWLIFWPLCFCSSSSCLCLYILPYIFPFTIFFLWCCIKSMQLGSV